MEHQEKIDYERIAKAIRYMQTHFSAQPSLEEVAREVHLSPLHFQKVFSAWAGTSPKKFIQYLSLAHAKRLLKEQQRTLFDTSFHTGFSSSSRLHELFIRIEGMSPATYKNGGKELLISYSFRESLFGMVLIASTGVGICFLSFIADPEEGLKALKQEFPAASFEEKRDSLQDRAMAYLEGRNASLEEVKLHLKGTPFQLKVWQALLQVPVGSLTVYGKIAARIGSPGASRATGSAIGANPVAYLIPCHRVIRSSGHFGGYRWGLTRKAAMIARESVQTQEPPLTNSF